MKVLKHLHKFFNRSSTPWVQLVWDNYYTRGRLPQPSPRGFFWWRDILKLLDSFKGLALVSLKDGASCLFRHDLWEGRILSQAFPERHSFAKKNQRILVQVAISTPLPQTLFHLSLSPEAFAQF